MAIKQLGQALVSDNELTFLHNVPRSVGLLSVVVERQKVGSASDRLKSQLRRCEQRTEKRFWRTLRQVRRHPNARQRNSNKALGLHVIG
jgi:hypothetical protein